MEIQKAAQRTEGKALKSSTLARRKQRGTTGEPPAHGGDGPPVPTLAPARPEPPPHALRIEEFGSGFLVEEPVLSLDLPDETCFNFCSGVHELLAVAHSRGPKRQTLLSEDAFNVLKWRGLAGSFLPCPYFRPLSLGHLTVELLPSGEGCGSSFLHISSAKTSSALYAHHWGALPSRAVRQAAPKPADVLVLRLLAPPAPASHAHDRKELGRFYDFAAGIVSAGEWVVSVLPSISAMHMVFGEMHLRGVPVYVDSSLLRGLSSLLPKAPTDEGKGTFEPLRRIPARMGLGQEPPGLIMLGSDNLRAGRLPALPGAIWCLLGECTVQQALLSQSGVALAERFPITFAPDMADIQSLVQAVQPRHVTVAGPGAEAVAATLGRQGLHTRAVVPAMLTLF